jgi:thiamine pyrophosphate-dependent acetolactate synthase large subunit-like protein
MNLSVLPDLGNIQPPNLTIIAFDNEVYESTGGQPSASAGKTDFAAMARATGIERSTTVRSLGEFDQALDGALENRGCDFIVTKVEVGVKKVPYLETSGHEMKFEFVRHIERTAGIKVLTPPEQQLPSQFIKG